MRLYLSSFRLGHNPKELTRLLHGKTRAAVITNAVDYKTTPEQRKASFQREHDDLGSLGIETTEVDLRDYFGKPEELRRALRAYDLLWVRGGNVFILRRAFRRSGADIVIPELLREDAFVYGGYSAGVCILTPNLHGIELVDDALQVPDGYDPEVIWDCLGILPYAVAPHYRSDHPESPAIENVVGYFQENHIPFKTLSDGQAIVIDGETEKLIV